MSHDEILRILPLSELDDFEVAEGHPDIRGWRVDAADGQEVGKVHDLLIDVDTMRTRYIDVRLASVLAASPVDRDVLMPIGTAELNKETKRVVVPLTAERVGLLPAYMHGGLTRGHEYEVRRHFSLGETAIPDEAVRIPLSPDDTVVMKKGEGGNDEIIIRRPLDRADQRSQT